MQNSMRRYLNIPLNKKKRGICPVCGKVCAVKKGVGPYAHGSGDVTDHKNNGKFCIGGKAVTD